MRWKVDMNKQHTHTQIIIQTREMTEEIEKLTTYIDQLSKTILVKKDEQQIKLDVLDMMYIENIERKTFIYTNENIYEIEKPLYEMEKILQTYEFARINKQTLLNPRYIRSVKALLNSRFELELENGEKLIVTRHYRKTFKAIFEKGGFYDA